MMALIALRQLLDHAAEHGYGVPTFNINNLEQIQAVMHAPPALRNNLARTTPSIAKAAGF